MNLIKSIRTLFSRIAGRAAANDNASLQVEVTPAELARALNPPADNSLVETLHGRKVSDPFRPLEDLTAAETSAWLARENRKFDDFMASGADVRAEVTAFLENAEPQVMQESMPRKYGNIYVVSRKKKEDVRWSVHVKDVPDYGAPTRVLLDPMQIDPSGKTNITRTAFTKDGKMLAYGLSVSGSDKETLKFMDVATGKDIDLVYKEVRTGVNWDRDGQGFHYNKEVEGISKCSAVLYHKMGTPVEDDKVVYNPAAPETGAGYFRLLKDSKDETGSYEWISVSNTEPNKHTLLVRPIGSNDAFREIFPHKEGTLGPIHEINGKIYAVTSFGAPNEKLVCFDVNDPAPEQWREILPENKEDKLSGAFIWQDRIFATYSHDTGEVLKVYDLSGKYLHDVPIPALSTFSMGGFDMEDTSCLISYNNFQEAGNVYKYDVTTNELTLHKKSIVPIDLKDCIVERVHATSKDGTKVPMTVIRHPDTKLDGTAATLLYGYGGFDVSLDPGFSPSIAQWVRAGGIYVQSNLRGGGEYGQAWYDAGRRENKQNVFDDFIACAEHLIDNGYTTNKRLAIQGGSNGGLLTLATILQRPDLFGAVISEVPVADMFRFHIGSHYGYGWKGDYGDPGIKEDFNIAAKYSPLHNVKKGFKHPPLLIKTDAHDDRVLPWHSYKMAAMLQAKEDEDSSTFLSIRTDGGHSAGMTRKQWCEDVGLVRAFLDKTLGPVNQNAYKAQKSWPRKVLKKFGIG